jgi:hypothetical protein
VKLGFSDLAVCRFADNSMEKWKTSTCLKAFFSLKAKHRSAGDV